MKEKVKDTGAPYYNKVSKLWNEYGKGKKFKRMVLSSSTNNNNDEEDLAESSQSQNEEGGIVNLSYEGDDDHGDEDSSEQQTETEDCNINFENETLKIIPSIPQLESGEEARKINNDFSQFQ